MKLSQAFYLRHDLAIVGLKRAAMPAEVRKGAGVMDLPGTVGPRPYLH